VVDLMRERLAYLDRRAAELDSARAALRRTLADTATARMTEAM
jgi:hypothetical protein